MLHGHLHRCVLGRLSRSAIVRRRGCIEVPYDDSWPHHSKLPVGLHEVFEERHRGFSKGDVYVDDDQLPRLAHQFICR